MITAEARAWPSHSLSAGSNGSARRHVREVGGEGVGGIIAAIYARKSTDQMQPLMGATCDDSDPGGWPTVRRGARGGSVDLPDALVGRDEQPRDPHGVPGAA